MNTFITLSKSQRGRYKRADKKTLRIAVRISLFDYQLVHKVQSDTGMKLLDS